MPVYGLPTALECSLNSLLTHKLPHSWRVSSHGEDITVVIRWPQNNSPSCTKTKKLVHSRNSVNEDSSGEEQTTKSKQRHMWSYNGKSLKRPHKEIEPSSGGGGGGGVGSSGERMDSLNITTKLDSDSRRKHQYDCLPSYPSPLPTTPFPVYLTASGNGSQTISYSYTEKKKSSSSSPRHATTAAVVGSDESTSKSRRRLKDIGKSDSFSGKSPRTSSPASSSTSSASSFSSSSSSSTSSSSSSSSSTTSTATISLDDSSKTKNTSRRRIKSEPSFPLDAKSSSVTSMRENEARNAESFYHTIARALNGYGEKQSGSATDSHFRSRSPGQILTSGNAEVTAVTNGHHSTTDDGIAFDHAERMGRLGGGSSVRSYTWDRESIHVDVDDV